MKKFLVLAFLCIGCNKNSANQKVDIGKDKWIQFNSVYDGLDNDWKVIEFNYNGKKHVYLLHEGHQSESIIKVE